MRSSQIERQMRRLTLRLPPAAAPFYWHAKANEPIGLLRGDVFVRTPKGRFRADGAVTARWRPTPHIAGEAAGPLHPLQMGNLLGNRESIELPSRIRIRANLSGEPVPVTTEPQTFSSSTSERYGSVGRRDLPFDEVRFGVPNFLDVLGPRVRWPSGTGWRIQLDAPNHVIVLDGRPDYSDIRNQLESEGGYALTHAGSLVAKRRLAVRTAEGLIDALHYFLSFAAGRWTGPVLPVGFRAGKPIWAQWEVGQLDPWGASWSWFDRHDAAALPTAYPRFLNLWRDSEWRDALKLSVAYWLFANRPTPVQAAIVFAQVCLEMLAKTTLVSRGLVTRHQARGLEAGVIIARLLQELHIDPAVPRALTSMHRWAGRVPPRLDGPTAIARLRNRVIHGNRTESEPSFRVWTDAWRLSTHYVELSLLALLGYEGQFSNRLRFERWVGQTEKVPWALAAPDPDPPSHFHSPRSGTNMGSLAK